MVWNAIDIGILVMGNFIAGKQKFMNIHLEGLVILNERTELIFSTGIYFYCSDGSDEGTICFIRENIVYSVPILMMILILILLIFMVAIQIRDKCLEFVLR